MTDTREGESAALEQKVAAAKETLGASGLSNAILMVDYLLGKPVTVNGKEYTLFLSPEEKSARLEAVFSFMEHPAEETLKKIDSRAWVEKDKADGLEVPVSDWDTPIGRITGKSLYGAGYTDLRAYWADQQNL